MPSAEHVLRRPGSPRHRALRAPNSDGRKEREQAIAAAIKGATLEGSHAEHFKNLLERLERDDDALIVLKGHVVIEERITAAIAHWH
jgi:hypothetical protein